MELAVIGAGYVGLVAAACFAETGNDVICVDVDENRVKALEHGQIPIYEPGLEEYIKRNVKEGRLRFSTSLQEATVFAKVIFIAVGTPQDEDGSADLSHVIEVAKGIAKFMDSSKVVVDKSTVPVGTGALVARTIREISRHPVSVVSNPEFLKEGAALDDFMKPDRVVIGTDNEETARTMRELYAPFVRTNNPVIVMDVASAEMTKYASNAMLATRVSFMNELANLCEKVGADINSVRVGMGSDSRIGMSFLFPGIGYGGSCFPKDVQALLRTALDNGVELKVPTAVEAVNRRQKLVLVEKLREYYATEDFSGKIFAVWGLSFKPRTDDVRESPALDICAELIKRGAKLQAYDPEAIETFKRKFGEDPRIVYAASNYQALKGVDALIVCTEWSEFRRPSFEKMRGLMREAVVFDGRNLFELPQMKREGFAYFSIGRVAIKGDC